MYSHEYSLGVSGVAVAAVLPGGPADPHRFDGARIEIGDTILSISGEPATEENIDDLLRGKSASSEQTPHRDVSIRFRKAEAPSACENGPEHETTLERGAAGTFMRFTQVAAMMAEVQKLHRQLVHGAFSESDHARLAAMLRDTHHQLLVSTQLSARAELTLFEHVSALEQALIDPAAGGGDPAIEVEKLAAEMATRRAEAAALSSARARQDETLLTARERNALQAQVVQSQRLQPCGCM